MAVENAPWAVDGAKHSGAVSRTLAYASTNGAEGVIGPGDLAVLATQTPSNQVRVMPGGAAIRNRAASGGQQTYTARNVSQTLVTVEPTGSSGGRTDYVWAHIVDPEYSGQVPENPLEAQYFFITASAGQPPGNGWYRLARINIPANTATITQAMITDLRQVANPRQRTQTIPRPVVNGDLKHKYTHVLRRRQRAENTDGGRRGEYFPDFGNTFTLNADEWATHVILEAQVTGVRYEGITSWGTWWVAFGDDLEHSTQDFSWDVNEGGVKYTTNWILSEQLYLPPKYRGRSFQAKIMAAVSWDTRAQTGVVSLNGLSGLMVRATYVEQAETGYAP